MPTIEARSVVPFPLFNGHDLARNYRSSKTRMAELLRALPEACQALLARTPLSSHPSSQATSTALEFRRSCVREHWEPKAPTVLGLSPGSYYFPNSFVCCWFVLFVVGLILCTWRFKAIAIGGDGKFGCWANWSTPENAAQALNTGPEPVVWVL